MIIAKGHDLMLPRLLLVFAFSVLPALAQKPRIFFTDLQSGPAIGGENNDGTILTIYGNNFGPNGSGCGANTKITVGGGAVAAYIGPCPTGHEWYQKIS